MFVWVFVWFGGVYAGVLCVVQVYSCLYVCTHIVPEMNCGMLGNEYVGICIWGDVWDECRSLSASVLGCMLNMRM